MAKDPRKQPAQEAAAAPPAANPKKKLMLVIIVALVLAAAGGGAAWFFLQGKGGDHKEAAKAEEGHKPPIFTTLDQFTVNLQGDNRYLQVGIDLKVADAKVIDQINLHKPEIKNGVLLLLSSKNAEELATLEGKQKLANELTETVNRPLGLPAGQGVMGVFFTTFVIQ
jgi:Flagellar basal body-associated protein